MNEPVERQASTAEVISRPITVVIPAFGAADELQKCLSSLAAYLPSGCSVLVLDDGTPDATVESVCLRMQPLFERFQYVKRDQNFGFVNTCNWGYANYWDGISDLLLLNSDTEVTATFLAEMQAVLLVSERHAVVTPRSNNATIFSVPSGGDKVSPDVSFDVWKRVRHLLPRFGVTPTAVGFCMLIRAEVLIRFDLFDDSYNPGYNEENDFVCRINRKGYSAVVANWAFVFHKEGSSFGWKREALEIRNREILDNRYPEYAATVARYLTSSCDPMEYYLHLYAPHRPRLLYDLFHLPAAFNGTAEFGLSLLRELSCLIGGEYDFVVGVSESGLAFFARELAGYKIYTEADVETEIFDLVFKPAQVFQWTEFKRMIRASPRLCFTLHDIIAARCAYLASADRHHIIRKSVELSDHIFTISGFSEKDFQSFFGTATSMEVIHHGSDFVDFPRMCSANKHVLVVGNDVYYHKAIEDAIAELDGEWPIVVLGGPQPDSTTAPANVCRHTSGTLPRQYLRQLFLQAAVVVYPSHYEGFGLPVLDSLSLGTPVVALDTEVNREIFEATHDRNLHLVPSVRQLKVVLARILAENAVEPSPELGTWRRVAEMYLRSFRQMLSLDIDLTKVRARWDLLRCVEAFYGHAG